MPINFSNINTIWASVLVETLARLGLTTAIICPGSRSAPLAIAFAAHPQVEAIPILDERSAAFFALGLAKRTHQPIVLVCTSGTASANFYAAIAEAHESCLPLVVLTADRPPELRHCNSGQTIDQQKLYGHFPNWYCELAVPELQKSQLAYLRQTVMHAWERSQYPVAGVVHLNLPFRDPLIPTPQAVALVFAAAFDYEQFFSFIHPNEAETRSVAVQSHLQSLPSQWFDGKGVIIAGVAQPSSPQVYCEAIAHLAKMLKFPVLAEGLSPVRHHAQLNPFLVSAYDLILRQPGLALAPTVVLRFGEMPTSKGLRAWLERTQPQQWIVDASDRNLDPLHGQTIHWRCSVEQLAAGLPAALMSPTQGQSAYLHSWLTAEAQARVAIDPTLQQTDELIESKVAWLISQALPPQTPVFVANSTPIRDVEWFWQPTNLATQLFCNRGANGIDGTLSSALGMAHRHRSSILLTGDLALLHDTNGFLMVPRLVGHLTIVLINNKGGGIFEMLPIAQFNPPFEEYFATPQSIDIAQLCRAYGVQHHQISCWEQLQQLLNPLPETGVRLLEVVTDRKASAQWRHDFFQTAWTGASPTVVQKID